MGKVIIPGQVEKIGDYVFSGCSSLKEATIKGNISCGGVFSNCFSYCSDELVLNVISGSRAEQSAIACEIGYRSVPGELDHYIYSKAYDDSPDLVVAGYDGTDSDLVIPSEYAGNKILAVPDWDVLCFVTALPFGKLPYRKALKVFWQAFVIAATT